MWHLSATDVIQWSRSGRVARSQLAERGSKVDNRCPIRERANSTGILDGRKVNFYSPFLLRAVLCVPHPICTLLERARKYLKLRADWDYYL